MRWLPARGAPRLRIVLAVVVASDLVGLGALLGTLRSDAFAEAVKLDAVDVFLSTLPARVTIGAVGLGATLLFARRPGQVGAGALALVALGVLSTVEAHLFGSPRRDFFFSGLCLLGWLAGLVVARVRGCRGEEESWAHTGALALLGAAYANAGISKLVYGGIGWASGAEVQATVVGQTGLVGGGLLGALRTFVASTPALLTCFAVATLTFELAGPLLLAGRRVRRLVATGLLGMHTGILLMTGIFYLESMVLLVAFGWLDGKVEEVEALAEGAGTPRSRGRFLAVAAVLAVCAAAAVSHQARRAERGRRHETAPRTAPPPIQRIGPLFVGERLGDSWTIAALDCTAGEGLAVTVAGPHGRVGFDLTCADTPSRSPLDIGRAHVFYRRGPPLPTITSAGQALRARLEQATSGQDVCAQWAAWTSSAR